MTPLKNLLKKFLLCTHWLYNRYYRGYPYIYMRKKSKLKVEKQEFVCAKKMEPKLHRHIYARVALTPISPSPAPIGRWINMQLVWCIYTIYLKKIHRYSFSPMSARLPQPQSALHLTQSSDGNVLLYLVNSKRSIRFLAYLCVIPASGYSLYGSQ